MLQPFKLSLLTLCLASKVFAAANSDHENDGDSEGSSGVFAAENSDYDDGDSEGSSGPQSTLFSDNSSDAPRLHRQNAMVMPKGSYIPPQLFVELCDKKSVKGWKKPLVKALKEKGSGVKQEIELHVNQAIEYLKKLEENNKLNKLLILNGAVNDLFQAFGLAAGREGLLIALRRFANAIDPERTQSNSEDFGD